MGIQPKDSNLSKWHRMTPEQKARRLASMKAWQQANKDRVRSYYKSKGTRPTTYGQKEAVAKYKLVRDLKIEQGECVECQFPCDEMTHVCFAWDHIDPTTKRFSLSKSRKFSFDEIKAEIAKCELVCHNCHALRTYLFRQNRTHKPKTQDPRLTLF